jgi:mannose-6-phosphate isomerase-like protein (cupin superfamily)
VTEQAGRPGPLAPVVIDAGELRFHHISPGDSVRLAVLAGPEISPVTVLLEAWDVGGTQPPNSHPNATELFVFLRGQGRATCDDTEVEVRAGDTIVLPAGTLHHIRNTGAERMYSLTLMCPDEGFAALVRRGADAPVDEEDRGVLAGLPARFSDGLPTSLLSAVAAESLPSPVLSEPALSEPALSEPVLSEPAPPAPEPDSPPPAADAP